MDLQSINLSTCNVARLVEQSERQFMNEILRIIAITLIGLQRIIDLCKRISQNLNWVKTEDKESVR